MSSIILPGRFYSQPQGPADTVEQYAAKRILFAYKLDNDFIYDGGPQRYHATASGYVQAISGSGLAWAGARNRNAASISNFVPSGSGAPITIVARVRPTGSDTAQDTLLQLGQYINDTPSRGRQIVIHLNTTNARDVYISFNGQDYRTAGGVFTAGTYFDIALRYTGDVLSTSTVSVLVDGASKALTKAGASSTVLDIYPGYPIRIARDNNSTTRDYRGDIDYIYAFDGALSDAEIADIHRDPWQLFKPRRRVLYFDAGVAGGGLSAILGQSAETDTAQPVGKAKYKAIGQASTTDAVLSVSPVKSLVVGQATESESALPMTVLKTAAVGLAAETDTAQPLVAGMSAAVGLATESDSALAIVAAKSITLGLATETDTAHPLEFGLTAALGQPVETDSVSAVSRAKTLALGIATETEFAQAVAAYKALGVLQPVEADSAHAITSTKTLSLGIVGETDTAPALGSGLSAALGQPAETDSVPAIAVRKTLVLGQATETGFAQAVAAYKTLGVLQPVEADSAHAIAGRSKTLSLGLASDAESALAVTSTGGIVTAPRADRIFVVPSDRRIFTVAPEQRIFTI